MDEQDAQIMVMDAIIKEKHETIRFLHEANMTMYGHYGRLIAWLKEGKVDEVIEILEASRKLCEDRLINR